MWCEAASFFERDSKLGVSLGMVVVKEEKPQTRMRAENAPPRKRDPSERNTEEVLFLWGFAIMGELLFW